ncbi:hypothetical protein [Sphingomonas sp. M1-B02]|uniref:hypothetical protein n=1 Tax=Sphingomonas sp. M1-B02 TaxID=3114300 RepID=UPI002240756E|nr:hypothetical protein [Sphingomonas sp. S6-11]UZK64661.1 hypothetical protein OKW87_08905 [Sphingomonas sp. S6-11]
MILTATGPTPAAQDHGNTKAAPVAAEKKVCRRAASTGSVMAKVSCRTKSEWDAMSSRGQTDAQRTLERDRALEHIRSSRTLGN